ncbi:hypothetical protein PI124_g5331 [Phytophthora idaei]|nr:hypothetical protein PI125_g5536 [Phytophthora idaei]KAG3153575.1 hypothetical protein PI126_g10018 [Phytophthora idaei]KAG3250017.1 hypothetical protein PI124_g5331 [Phytophthora idaei]
MCVTYIRSAIASEDGRSEEAAQIATRSAVTDVGGVTVAIPTEVRAVAETTGDRPNDETETQQLDAHEASALQPPIQSDTEDESEDLKFVKRSLVSGVNKE